MTNLVRRTAWSEPILLSRFDPFQALLDMMRWDPFAPIMQSVTNVSFIPSVELKETKDAFVVQVDVPGLDEDDIQVTMTGNTLSISGKRDEEKREEGARYYAYERSYGTFSRSFTLPEGCDPENVCAELSHGVLKISVPKKAEVQPKQIPIGAAQKQPKRIEETSRRAA